MGITDGAAGASSPAPLLTDKRVSALQSAAGSTEAVSRGKWIGAAIVVVGMAGAIGVALRPIYTKSFAARAVKVQRTAAEAKRAIAREAGEGLSPTDQARLETIVARLHVLQAGMRERHPLWYPDDGGSAAGDQRQGVAVGGAGGQRVPTPPPQQPPQPHQTLR